MALRARSRKALTTLQVSLVVFVIVVLVAAALILAAPTFMGGPSEEGIEGVRTVTITDSAGRNVTVTLPVERVVVLNTDAAEAMCILGSRDRIVGVSDTVASKDYLHMENLTTVGSWRDPNYEAIAELKPQIVISYARWPGSELEEMLTPFNITVVRLDFYKPETFDSDLTKLAMILEREDVASSFISWKRSMMDMVEDRLMDLQPEEKVKVYVEFGSRQWKTFSQGSATHQAIVAAGGINIAEGFNVSYPEVSAEWVLEQNPDVIVIADYGRVSGYSVEDYAGMEQLWEDTCNRLELMETNAVKNGRVYIVNSKLLGGMRTFIGELYLAKWFYPERFQDVDPEVVLRDYFELWLGVEYRGVYAYPPFTETTSFKQGTFRGVSA